VRRHEFQPGKLIAGVFLTVAGITYAGDAGGLWDTPWYAIFPMVTVGLCLAGATAFVTHVIRRRHPDRDDSPSGATRAADRM